MARAVTLKRGRRGKVTQQPPVQDVQIGLGARIDGNGFDVDIAGAAPSDALPWNTFEDAAHCNKKFGYIQFGTLWFPNFMTSNATKCRNRSAIPHMETQLKKADGTSWTLAEIAAGNADAALTTFANAAAAWGFPFMWRLWWEFNGPWETEQFNHPTDFKNAWRYVHDFVNPIAPNTTFLWNANMFTATSNAVDPTPWWPGAAYVDWVGFDTYVSTNGGIIDSWDPVYNLLTTTLAPGKPLYIETGRPRSFTNPDQIGWHNQVFDNIQTRYPACKVILFFHRDDGTATGAAGWAQATFDNNRPLLADPYFRAQWPLGAAGTKVATVA